MEEVQVGKNSILLEIIEIEKEIKRIASDSKYRKIRKNIEILNNRRFGNRSIIIPTPDDMSKNIQVRVHSDEMKSIIDRYEEKRSEYKDRLSELYQKRRKLKEILFG